MVNDISRVKNEWTYVFNTLPTKTQLEEYLAQTDEIVVDVRQDKIKGLIRQSEKIKQLKSQLESEISNINLNKKAMLIDIDSLTTKKNRALGYVQSDIKNLKTKYTPDIQGLRNFSKYFFKNDILQRIDEGVNWYNSLPPVLQYAYKELRNGYTGSESLLHNGIDVQFPDFNPQPSFLIKSADISLTHSLGNFHGELKNLTNQQNITGLPMSFIVNGHNLPFAELISLNSQINRVSLNDKKDDLSMQIIGHKINEKQFKIIKDWNLKLSNGIVDRTINLSIVNGRVKSNIKFNYKGTSIISDYRGEPNRIVSIIDSVLAKINNFYVDINVDGMLTDYKLNISSNIDNLINTAVTNIAKLKWRRSRFLLQLRLILRKKNYILKLNLNLTN